MRGTTTTTRGCLDLRWRLACLRAAMEYANAEALLRAMLDAVGMDAIDVRIDDDCIVTGGDGPSLHVERRIPTPASLAPLAPRPHWVVDKPVSQPATQWDPGWTDVVEASAHLSIGDACQALVLLWVENKLASVRENTRPPFPPRWEWEYWGWEEDDDERRRQER